MRVSVIIPAIDEASAIAGAIDSAVRSGADEIIVADGGSVDETVAKAKDCSARVVSSATGRAVQQNAGAAIADGDVLLFLHADCRLDPSAVESVRKILSASAVGGYFRQRIEHPRPIYRLIEAGNLLRAKTLKWAYGDQGIFVRRDVFLSVDGFPDVEIMEDLYLMKRLKRRGQLVCVDSPLVVSPRRWEESGAVHQTLRNWTMLTATHLGISPSRLVRFYPRAAPGAMPPSAADED